MRNTNQQLRERLENEGSFQDRWIRKYGGRVVRYDELPPPAQLAAAWFLTDAEYLAKTSWKLPPDAPMDFEEIRDEFPSYLPFFRRKYGGTKWGYVEVPMRELTSAVMQTTIGEDFPSFDKYHRSYVRSARSSGRWPAYSKKSPWPVILSPDDDEIMEDGWHRFHRYYDLGLRNVPALYLPRSRRGR